MVNAMKAGSCASAALAVAAAIAGGSPAWAQSVEQFYRDRQISMIVGFGPGGGYDAYTRVLARHIGRHIPGNPQVIVQNMPGAASLKSVQYLDSGAPKDGSVIAAFNSGLLTESVVNADKIQFKFSDVAWIGSISRDLRACYAWAGTGIRNFDDLRKRKQFNMGAAAPGTASFMNATVLKNMLGVAVHLVTGYRGSGELRIAIERGELDGDCGTWSSLPSNWTGNRRINPVVRFSSMPVPGVAADVPFVGDLTDSRDDRAVLDVLLAPDALGRPYVASKQVPADRLAALRAAFEATMQDGQFIAEAEKMELPVIGSIPGLAAEAIVESTYRTSPALIARARAVIAR
jgi:tripartite-type tricarboxylate transporter receptor subunit TctC